MSSEEDEGYSNPWNEYQHNHAGQGWSRSEMSENYQEYKANGYESSSDEYERGNNSKSYNYGRVSSSDEEKSSSNPWNDYQHQNAGQGWSRSEMSKHYHQDKANNYQSSQSANEDETYNNPHDYGYNNAKDSYPAEEQSYSNPWNKYQHQNAGQGWSQGNMSKNYQKYKATRYQAFTSEDKSETWNLSNSNRDDNAKYSRTNARKSYTNSWNQYQHQNAGRGWSRSEMSRHYQNGRDQAPISAPTVFINSSNTNKQRVGHSAHKCQTNRANQKLSKDDHFKQTSSRFSSENYATFHNRDTTYTGRGFDHNSSGTPCQSHDRSGNADRRSRDTATKSREPPAFDYNNNAVKINKAQAQSKVNAHPKLTWRQYEHLYKGQGKTSAELSRMYHEFRAQEQSFQWLPHYQLEYNPNGQLVMNTAAGQEAMKTGLFDEQGYLRNKKDQIPWPVFKAKLQQMNIDSKIASAMRNNYTGSDELHASHLKTSSYRQHIPQHDSSQRCPRDADHILEPQVCVPHLRQEKMTHYDFQILIEELNSKDNIKSTGQIKNRQIKRNANIGISINKPFLNVETFKQEKLQASQAQLMAQKCEARGAHQAAQIFHAIAEKCNQLNSIHQALNQMKMDTAKGKLPKQSDVTTLVQQIITYENKYGTLEFRGGNVTQEHLRIFDQVHKQQREQ